MVRSLINVSKIASTSADLRSILIGYNIYTEVKMSVRKYFLLLDRNKLEAYVDIDTPITENV